MEKPNFKGGGFGCCVPIFEIVLKIFQSLCIFIKINTTDQLAKNACPYKFAFFDVTRLAILWLFGPLSITSFYGINDKSERMP